MSSSDLENYGWSPRAPSDRMLLSLKMHGAQTSAQVGGKLGITGEAARQQLVRLSEDGLVGEEKRSAGRGRPSVYWHLTEKGQARFPDTHAALTVDILKSVRDLLGPEALDRVIGARESATQALYQAAMSDCTSLKDRVEKLAQLRSEDGYMASAEEADDGSVFLIENHCPICAAASLCQGFCRAEKAVFENVLGPGARVEREEHIIAGGRRCTYRISEAG
ncbi:helix-turn-helix transcriptional regulator [Psychromarinibacter halotolerans]